MRLAVVGVTGLVGTVMNQVLEEMKLPITEYIPVASEKSVGKKIQYAGNEYTIVGMQEAVDMAPDVAIFSAGGSVSLEWAPKFAEVGTTVVDNSSAWRMDPTKVLCVPEINGNTLTKEDKIIANPNCSTIQMVLALSQLHKTLGIKRLVVSTYQSFTGTGVKAVAQYEAERDGKPLEKSEMAYHYQIYENCIPQCDVFLDNGYTKEEMK
nr:aspartate-semialdehyde dehydrogenase [Saprospiraceae bacterium]